VNQKTTNFQALPSRSKGNQMSFSWWGKHEAMFPTIGFLARKILEIVGSQIMIN
jgi:hypothetical protein